MVKNYLEILKWLIGAVGAFVVTMASISPEQAGSNIAAWAKVFGWETPQWLAVPSADTWGIWIGSMLVCVAIGWITWPIITRLAPPKAYSNKPSRHPATIEYAFRSQTSRLSQVKKQLRRFVVEAGQMYDKILSEKIATQNLSEAERRGRLSVFVAPDVRRWHADVKAFIEKELGEAQANEFAREYRFWDQYDWTDLTFLIDFLRRKKTRLHELANRITKADLE